MGGEQLTAVSRGSRQLRDAHTRARHRLQGRRLGVGLPLHGDERQQGGKDDEAHYGRVGLGWVQEAQQWRASFPL